MADEAGVSEYPSWESGMIGSARCEGSTAVHAGINVQVYRVPVILMDEECAVGGGDETIKPGEILAELRGEGKDPCYVHCLVFRVLSESIHHLVEEQADWRTHL